MPPVFVIVLIVLVGLALYAFVGKARAEKDARKAYFAAGVAVQALRELQRNALPGSSDQFALNGSLSDIENSLKLVKES